MFINGLISIGVFLTGFVAIWSVLLSLGLSANFSSEFVTAFVELGKTLQVWNLFLPIDTLIISLKWAFTILLAVWTVKMLLWITGIMRGAATSS